MIQCDSAWVGIGRCKNVAIVRLLYIPTSDHIECREMNACKQCAEDFTKNAGTYGFPYMVEVLSELPSSD
jgi:hypothetical protein